jgi:hypothetical protein
VPESAPAQPDGAIDAFMSRLFGRSWKTTCTGILAVVGTVVQLIPGIPPEVKHGVGIGVGVLTGTGLIAAKDKNVSGTGR